MHIFSVLMLLLGLAACTQDDADSLPEGKYPIVIRATGLSAAATPASRATVDGNWQGITSDESHRLGLVPL